MVRNFAEAMDSVAQANLERLRRLVGEQPELLRATDDADHPATLLHAAAEGTHPAVVSTLLELGAEVDFMTWATPLNLAASYGRTESARILLDAGAAFDARTNIGATPLATAVFHGHSELADLLATRGIVPRTLWVAAGLGALDLVKSFLHPDGSIADGAGAHREDPHEYGMPKRPLSNEPSEIIEEAFKFACINGRIPVAEYLLNAGVNINSSPHIGTALHWAAYSGRLDMVEFLVERGADVTALDDEWNGTPQSWAAENGHQQVIAFLAEHDP